MGIDVKKEFVVSVDSMGRWRGKDIGGGGKVIYKGQGSNELLKPDDGSGTCF